MITLSCPPYTIKLREGFPAGEVRVLTLDDGQAEPSSCHRVEVYEGDHRLDQAQLETSGGATGVHDHSAVVADDTVFVACGPYITALRLPELELQWSTQVDEATCFGVYLNTRHFCLVSHGELSIARVNFDGSLVWQAMGKDTFSGTFATLEDRVEA
ncbi:MAG: hypothetical protein ACAI34_00895, partial [Verrucomicrobium sp.]